MTTFKNDWRAPAGNEFCVSEKRPRPPSGVISEFGRSTSIHGVRHFTNKRNHILERLFWASILIISLFICFNLLLNILCRWNEGPIIVGLADKTESIRNVPFPAVTICPETKTKKVVFDYTSAYHSKRNDTLSAEQESRLEAIAQICDAHLAEGLLPDSPNFTDESVLKKLQELAPLPEEVLFYCKWRNQATTCLQFFKKIWTDDGLCFTFNLIDNEEMFSSQMKTKKILVDPIAPQNVTKSTWTLENGYTDFNTKAEQFDLTYPHHSYGAGLRGGLNVLLRLYDYDLEYMCRGPVQGFKVLLHLPNEYPQIANHYFRVPLNMETFVTITPRVTTTANSLKYHKPESRGCYYSNERQLKFFNEYTQRNCELECISNITMHKCGCVKFSTPHGSSTPICGAAKVKCYNDAVDDLLKFNGYGDGNDQDINNNCKCLPSCTSISYDHEVSQAPFDYKSLFIAFKSPLTEFPGMLNARLTISFKDNHFVALKRHELYSHVDLLALCGGILAFFFGASMLSLFELVHFFSSKIFCRTKYSNNCEQEF